MSEPEVDADDRPGPSRGVGRSAATGLLATAGTVAAITVLARVVGFGRWFAFSHSVGATCVGSVYQSVNAVPNVLYEVAAGGVLSAVAVPLVAGALARGRRAEADATASALLTWAVAVLVPLALLVLLAAEPVARLLLGTGCTGEVELGTELLRMFAVQIPLYGVGIVLAGVLQSHRRFVAAALAPLLSSVVVIATYLAYRGLVDSPAAAIPDIPEPAVLVLGLGTTLGVVALSLPLLLPVRHAGIRLRPRLRFPEGLGGRVRTLALAGLLAVAGQQVATLVVIALANDRGGPGTLTVFTYAQAVTLLPYAVLAVPLATTAFPSLAAAQASRDDRDDRDDRDGARGAQDADASDRRIAAATLRRAWVATVVVSLCGAAVLVAVSGPVGAFFVQLDAGSSGDVSFETLSALDDALVLFAPAVVALAVTGLLTRACYVRGSAVLAGSLAAAGWLASAVGPWLTLPDTGASGPAALRSLSAWAGIGLALGAVLLVVLVGRTWGWPALSVPLRPLAATVTGAGLAAVAGRATSSWLALNGIGTSLGGAVVVAGLVGVLACGVTAGVAVALDPSLVRRVRQVRGLRSRGRVAR